MGQPGRGMGRRTSLAQQISLADVNPAAAAERRATLAQKRDEEAKPKPRGPSVLGVDAASLAELVARHEAMKVVTIDEGSSEASDEEEEPLFMPEDMRCLALLAEVRRMWSNATTMRVWRTVTLLTDDRAIRPRCLAGVTDGDDAHFHPQAQVGALLLPPRRRR